MKRLTFEDLERMDKLEGEGKKEELIEIINEIGAEIFNEENFYRVCERVKENISKLEDPDDFTILLGMFCESFMRLVVEDEVIDKAREDLMNDMKDVEESEKTE